MSTNFTAELAEARAALSAAYAATTVQEGDDYEETLDNVNRVLRDYFAAHPTTELATDDEASRPAAIDPRSFDSPAQRTAARMYNTARNED